MPGQRTTLFFRRQLTRALAVLAAGALLMPLPALAFTFTGSWMAAYNQIGDPIPAQPTFAAVDHGSATDLTVDMKEYQGVAAPALSQIQLTRTFAVQNPNDLLNVQHHFDGDFKQAGVAVTVAVKDSSGGVNTLIDFSNSTSSTDFTRLKDNEHNKARLGPGDYTLVVTVTYTTNDKLGGWKRKKSQHDFQFDGGSDG